MEEMPYNIARAEFETLLGRYLFGDLDRYGKRRLQLLCDASADFAAEFAELARLDEAVQNSFPAVVDAVLRPGRASSRRWPAIATLAAAAVAVSALVGLWFFSDTIGARMTAWLGGGELAVLEGECASDRQLEDGLHFIRVRAGLPDFCELQIADNGATVRLLPGAVASWLQRDGRIELQLREGRLLAIGHRPGADSILHLYARDRRVRMIGTRVYLSLAPRSLRVDVIEGQVAVDRLQATPEGVEGEGPPERQTIGAAQAVKGDNSFVVIYDNENQPTATRSLEAGTDRLTQLRGLSESETPSDDLPQALDRLEANSPTGPHVVFLRDGRVLYGRAYQQGDALRVEGPDGPQRVPMSNVRRIQVQ